MAFIDHLGTLEVQHMLKSLRRLLRNKKGATAVEYGIMVAAISAVIIATVVVVGGEVFQAFEDVRVAFQGITP